MTESNFASLSPTLLARKGGARPAMRPQLPPIPDQTGAAGGLAIDPDRLEDLGWNDMGFDALDANHASAQQRLHPAVAGPGAAMRLVPSPAANEQAAFLPGEAADDEASEGKPDHQGNDQPQGRAPLQARAGKSARNPGPAGRTPAAGTTVRAEGRRAAFTLRLDAERHLRLRLAATLRQTSAQKLVTEALDRLLAEIGELDAVIAGLKKSQARKPTSKSKG